MLLLQLPWDTRKEHLFKERMETELKSRAAREKDRKIWKWKQQATSREIMVRESIFMHAHAHTMDVSILCFKNIKHFSPGIHILRQGNTNSTASINYAQWTYSKTFIWPEWNGKAMKLCILEFSAIHLCSTTHLFIPFFFFCGLVR